MSAFIFMLTQEDETVTNAESVYESVRTCGLRYVGFKDIGLPKERLATVTKAAHEDGLEVILEVVSLSLADEARSIQIAKQIGVDWVLGGTYIEAGAKALEGTGIKYCPFIGEVVGHPSLLHGTVGELASLALQTTSHAGVYGLDLLAYRHTDENPTEVIRRVIAKSQAPVIVAGSISTPQQIALISAAGAWGFTIGSAIFNRLMPGGLDVPDQVAWVVKYAASLNADSNGMGFIGRGISAAPIDE